MIDHFLSEEPFPTVQPEFPHMQIYSNSSCPITGQQRAVVSTCPSTYPSGEAVVAAMQSSLSLLFSRLNKPSDPSQSSYGFPSRPSASSRPPLDALEELYIFWGI